MTWMDIWGKFISQVTSGRWLITIGAIYCLIALTKTLCALMIEGKVTLESSTYVAIVMSVLNSIGMVTVFYFQKPRIADDGNGNGDTTTTDTTTTLLPTK